MGCRNVSKLYIPKDYDLNLIFGGLFHHAEIIKHPKYANNYDYNKAVFLMSEFDLLDNGFMLIREEASFSSPVACLHYSYYKDKDLLAKELTEKAEEIQCISTHLSISGAVPFGKAQQPSLWEYADGVDPISFLLEI